MAHARLKAGATTSDSYTTSMFFRSKFLLGRPQKPLTVMCRQIFREGGPNDFHNFTDLMNEWRKYLTPEAGTPNMAVAPAAAFPSIVVPLIRMPE
jgi:hypothetical protein